MDLRTKYEQVNAILERVPFAELFPSFKKYQFALYDDQEICLDGALMPYREEFRGNTAIEFNGGYIAIWHTTDTDDRDMGYLAQNLAHEMFHCFQNENKEERFPDDLQMLNCPTEDAYYALKQAETQALAGAFQKKDRELFRTFHELRNLRLKRYGAFVAEELKAETIEGAAEYIGALALKTIDGERYQAYLGRAVKALSDRALLFDARRSAYFTGTVFCLTLHDLGYSVKDVFDQTPLYLQNRLYESCAEGLAAFEGEAELGRELQERTEKNRAEITAQIQDKCFVVFPAAICGYDPMNMIRVGNLIFCKHFVALQNEREQKFITRPVVVKLQAGSDCTIEGYYE